MRYKTRRLSDKDHKEIVRWLEAHGYEPEPILKIKDIPINEQIKTLETYLRILKKQRSKHEQLHPQTGEVLGQDGSLDD